MESFSTRACHYENVKCLETLIGFNPGYPGTWVFTLRLKIIPTLSEHIEPIRTKFVYIL